MSSDRAVTETPGKAFRALAELRWIWATIKYLTAASVPVIFGILGLAYGKIGDSAEKNLVQDEQIRTIEKRADEDRNENRRMQQVIFDTLQRIAERVGAAK